MIFKKGNIPWNKGKKCIQLKGENNGFYGKKHSEKTKEINRQKHLGKSNNWSEKSKKKMSESRRGNPACISKGQTYEEVFGEKKAKDIQEKQSKSLKGKPKSKEHIKKIKQNRAKQILPKKDTSIEVKIQEFLKQLGIEFFTHQYMKIEHGYQCDILIPSMNLVIECDGDYWHKYPVGNEIDHVRTSELINKGFKVLRLWEFEIKKMELNDFKNKLK